MDENQREWVLTKAEWHMILVAAQDYLEQSKPELLAKIDQIHNIMFLYMGKGAHLEVKAKE